MASCARLAAVSATILAVVSKIDLPDYTIRIESLSGKCIFCPNTYTDSYSKSREKISGQDKLELTPVGNAVDQNAE